MRHQIPGLHSRHQDSETSFDGVFLVRVERAWYRRHPQKPFVELRLVILEPQSFQDRSFFSRLYLHREGPMEAPLVSSRFWLRCRPAQP